MCFLLMVLGSAVLRPLFILFYFIIVIFILAVKFNSHIKFYFLD
jgi:hypothetical protein